MRDRVHELFKVLVGLFEPVDQFVKLSLAFPAGLLDPVQVMLLSQALLFSFEAFAIVAELTAGHDDVVEDPALATH